VRLILLARPTGIEPVFQP